jgi:hypothetical protein
MPGFFELDEDESLLSLREYARVNAYLPVRIRRVPEEERLIVRSRIAMESALIEHPDMPQLEDEVLWTCLQILNAKLDSIIRLLSLQSVSHKELGFELLNISAGGMSMTSREAYTPDDVVEVLLMLPTAPCMIFYVYGNVVKCEGASPNHRVCIEFTEIDNDVREQIAKYVFDRQRKILRTKRSEKP